MNKQIDEGKNYATNSLGYHYLIGSVVFGTDSPAIKFLQKKADESPNGFDEMCVAPEGQVVALLFELHNSEG